MGIKRIVSMKCDFCETEAEIEALFFINSEWTQVNITRIANDQSSYIKRCACPNCRDKIAGLTFKEDKILLYDPHNDRCNVYIKE